MAITNLNRSRRRQRGFTILEALIASVILAVGLVGLLGLFVTAVASMQNSQEELLARQKARETLESIYAARNSQQITFDGIENVTNGGVFQNGTQLLANAGPDGIFGTADDTDVESITLPGADGVLGTADDTQRILNEFRREIRISPLYRPDGSLNPDLRQIDVVITYATPQGQRSYSTAGYVSRYR